MRFVIFGAGAIGGVVGARLHEAGFEVALIARGAHLEALRRSGLTLETPLGRSVFELPAAEHPAELDLRPEDVVLLATKGQDTDGALRALRRCWISELPIVCLQNGVNNERAALRVFSRVYAGVVMLPAAHIEPGVVMAYGTRLTGIIDVGVYPDGSDELCEQITAALAASKFASQARTDIMRFKYAKLILNLGNAAAALCGPGDATDELNERVRSEGRTVLEAAGLDFEASEVDDLEGRSEWIGVQPIGDRPRAGSSSWQSLARGTGAIETDYLNGEVVLLGRLHGVPTPLNAALCELADRQAQAGGRPGELSVDDVLAVTV
jgi:2-dehydropantoate 2-reductase